jgi:hypothetical protein
VEDHGDIYEDDIHDMKPFELELEKRGLVVKPRLTDASRKEDEF